MICTSSNPTSRSSCSGGREAVHQFELAGHADGELQLTGQPFRQFRSLLHAGSNFCPHLEFLCPRRNHKLIPIPHFRQLHQEFFEIERRKLNTAYFNLLDTPPPEEQPGKCDTARTDIGINISQILGAVPNQRRIPAEQARHHYLPDFPGLQCPIRLGIDNFQQDVEAGMW